MKRFIVAFLILALSLASCSDGDDDDALNTGAMLSMTINGQQKTFTNIFSQKVNSPDGTHLTLFLGTEADPDETVVINLFVGETGSNVIDAFYYNNGAAQSIPNFTNGSFTNNVSINTNSHFEAVFSGEVKNGNSALQIIEGTISVAYPVIED